MKPNPLSLLVSTSLALSGLPAIAQQQTGRDLHGAMAFEGRYLVSAQDADMLASAYVNGALGPREGEDTLAVIPLDGDPRDWTASEVPASNSVAGPPAVVDITPDGAYAFTIETFTQRPEGDDDAQTFADFRMGKILNVFSLADPSNPVRIQQIETLDRPDAIRVSSDGTMVAVSFNVAGGGAHTPLAIYPFSGGTLGEPVMPTINGWPVGAGRMIDIDWHPTEPILAMIDELENTLRFARVDEDLSVTPFGNVVDVERTPFRLEFTPDGRHIVVNGLYWGPDIAGRWIEAPRGAVMTVRMNAETRPDGSVRHAFVSRATTGVSPEGLTVSPDGQWVVTTNLERSYLPYDDDRITWFSSLTLVRLNPETGQLSEAGTFSYDGILPEAAVFDNSGQYLAVATFDHFDDRKTGSSIDFWRIQADPLDLDNVQLIKTEHSVPVARGAHSMVIAR